MANPPSVEVLNRTVSQRKRADRSSIGRPKGVLFKYKSPDILLTTRCRTHRERKEQYIKALEIEVSRLREVFVDEQKTWQGNLEQHQIALHELQQENHLLKDMLASNGIHFEGELEARKVALGIQPNVPQAPVGPNITATRPPAFQTVVSGSKPAPGYQIMSEQGYTNGQKGSLSGSVSAHSPYNHSTVASSPPLLPEPAIKQEVEPVSDMPGVFEQDPQLGVEFILA